MRWKAFVTYKTQRPVDVYDFEELYELDPLVEAGPDWNEIEEITVHYQYGESEAAA